MAERGSGRGRRRSKRRWAAAAVLAVLAAVLVATPALALVGQVISEPFATGGPAGTNAIQFTHVGQNPYLLNDSWTPHGAINATACNRGQRSVAYAVVINLTFSGLRDITAVDVRMFGWGFLEDGSYTESPIALSWLWYDPADRITLSSPTVSQGGYACVGFSFDLYAVFTPDAWQGGSYWFELSAKSA